MKYFHPPFLSILVLISLIIAPIVTAQDDSAGAKQEAEEKDWLEFYYENPTPERFVQEMKNWAADGTLKNEFARPALIAFISQLIRQNKSELKGWFNELAGLTPDQKKVLYTAMLFSRTTEADELMKEAFGDVYEEQKQDTPKILDLPLDKRTTIDMLWGFYYATGSEHAIRRIILCLRFEEAPNKPEGVDVPEGYNPLYKELPFVAVDSLLANADRHDRVRKMIEIFYKEDDTLVPGEKRGLYEVLSELYPKTYPRKENPKYFGDPE